MADEYIEKLCVNKHEQISEKLEQVTKILDSHADDIKDIKETTMKSISTIEKAIGELTIISKNLSEKINEKKEKFWDSKTGQRILTFLFIVGGAIVTVAFGVNIMNNLK